MSFINIAILTLVVVLALVALMKKDKKITDYFLFAIITVIALYIASNLWVHASLNRHSFALHSIAGYLPFLPILFYSMLLISKQHRIRASWLWFTVFHIAYYVFIIGDVYLWNDYQQADIQKLYVDPPWTYHFFYKGLHVYMIVVLIWFLGNLRTYQSTIKDYYSNLEGVNLTWLKYFLWVYISVYSTSFSAMLLLNFGVLDHVRTAFLLISISILCALLWMIYHGLRSYTLANFSEATPVPVPNKKYATSSLRQENAKELFKNIQSLFEEDEVYKNADLKVQDLALKLGVTNHNISQTLNEVAGKTFFEFVNDYRLAHFQKLLVDPSNRKYTILALGMDSGFNSKASLNRIFKKYVGESPSEYQQRIQATVA